MKLKIFSWNVNGLKAISKKNAFLWLNEMKPDILCLQEIRTLESDIPICFDYKYKNIIVNSGQIKGQSGTLMYSDIDFKNSHFCEKIDINSEGRIIENRLNNTIIFNIYFPNGKSSKERLEFKIRFFNEFYHYCKKLDEEGFSIVICGDFNVAHREIDLKKTKIIDKSGFSYNERLCIDKFMANGYIDTYRYIYGDDKEAYTWWSYRSGGREKNEGWRIDYILISQNLKNNLINAFILDNVIGSDHCPIGIEINI